MVTFSLENFSWQMASKIDEKNTDIVHHILVHLCTKAIDDNFAPKDFQCGLNATDPGYYNEAQVRMNCTEILAAWAVGGVV